MFGSLVMICVVRDELNMEDHGRTAMCSGLRKRFHATTKAARLSAEISKTARTKRISSTLRLDVELALALESADATCSWIRILTVDSICCSGWEPGSRVILGM